MIPTRFNIDDGSFLSGQINEVFKESKYYYDKCLLH